MSNLDDPACSSSSKSAFPGSAKAPTPGSVNLFVGGLRKFVNDVDLEKHFEKYGEVLEAHVVKEHATAISRRFGYVTVKLTDPHKLLSDQHVIKGKTAGVELHHNEQHVDPRFTQEPQPLLAKAPIKAVYRGAHSGNFLRFDVSSQGGDEVAISDETSGMLSEESPQQLCGDRQIENPTQLEPESDGRQKRALESRLIAKLESHIPMESEQKPIKKKRRAAAEEVLGLACIRTEEMQKPGRVVVLSSPRPLPSQSPKATTITANSHAADSIYNSVVVAPSAPCTEASTTHAAKSGASTTKATDSRHEEWVCYVCRRVFSCESNLHKHEQLSDLHKENLAKRRKKS